MPRSREISLKAATRLAASGIAATATALLTTEQLDLTHVPRAIDLALVGVVGATGVGFSGQQFWWEAHGAPKERLRLDVEEVLRQTARSVADKASVPRPCLGLNVHEVRQPWRGEAHLVSVARVRDDAHPAASPNIVWSKGKGIIGQCWEEGRIIYKDLHAFASKHQDCTRPKYDSLSAGKQLGMSFKEFAAMIGKYSSVLAYPIVVDAEFIGCLTLDLPLTENFPGALDQRAVRELAGFAARSVGKLLK